MTYPTNYIEQLLYANNLQTRLDAITNKVSKVTVRSFRIPLQSEWEDAYFKQTGNPPPIPVGVKLVWYNYQSNEARLFSTAYDLNGGLTSSGTVREAVDNTYNRPPFRFIAKATSATGFGYANPNNSFIFGSITNTGGTDETIMVRMDLSRWSKRGLLALFMIYEIRATANPMNLSFLFSGKGQLSVDGLPIEPSLTSNQNRNDTTDWYASAHIRQNLAGDSVVFNPNATEANSTGVSTGGIVSDNTSPANTFMSGIMTIGNSAIPYVTGGVHDTPKANGVIYVNGHIQRSTLVTNSLYMYETYLARTDGLPAIAAPFLGMNAALTSGAIGSGIQRTGAGNTHSESVAWLYGIFSGPTNKLSEFDE